MAVAIFGTRWPVEFKSDMHGVDSSLNYSFYVAVAVVPLTYLAGVFVVIDLCTSKILIDNKYHQRDPELQDDDDYADALVVGSSHTRIHVWDSVPDSERLAPSQVRFMLFLFCFA
jgi:hypothetical protein